MSRGLEEFEGPRDLGVFLMEIPGGRHIMLRGKFRGGYLDTIPRGYLRKYVLQKWIEDMSEEERTLFEKYGRKEDGEGNED
jgi:hypothetical protein